MKLIETDFQPIETCKLLYRWTRPANELASQELKQIHPLTAEKAAEIYHTTISYAKEMSKYIWDYHVSKSFRQDAISFFTTLRIIEAQHVEQAALVSQALLALEAQQDMLVVVMWEPTIAVVVPWYLFYSRWDDFCYPVSDDICIFPVSEQWVLGYSHWQIFLFGELHSVGKNSAIREQLILMHTPRPFIHQDELLRLLQTKQPHDRIKAIRLYSKETGILLKQAVEDIEKLEQELRFDVENRDEKQ